MTEALAKLIPYARSFFAELAANISRACLDANGARFSEQIRKPAEALAGMFAAGVSRLTSLRLLSFWTCLDAGAPA